METALGRYTFHRTYFLFNLITFRAVTVIRNYCNYFFQKVISDCNYVINYFHKLNISTLSLFIMYIINYNNMTKHFQKLVVTDGKNV